MELVKNDNPLASSSEPEKQEMKIYLKVMKTIALNVKSSESIYNVKEKFQDMEGIGTNLQELFFAGNHLKDNKTLADYQIAKCSTLNMFVSTDISMQILVKIPPAGMIISIKAKIWDTVLAIKAKIRDKEGIRLERQMLVYSGKILEDGQTLAAYNIKRDFKLHLILRPTDGVQVSVDMPSGKKIILEVKEWCTISDVKTMIESMEQVPTEQHKLIYSGKKLEDKRTLSDYEISEKCVLQLVFSPLQILVKPLSGGTITLEVEREDTIDKVRAKIQTKMGIQTMKYTLVFAGRALKDDNTLDSYGVEKGSTLHMRCG